MGVVAISGSTYKFHARNFLQPTTYKVWKTEQEQLLTKLSRMDGGLVLGGDGRADSPGK
jgi:hypothetical protein